MKKQMMNRMMLTALILAAVLCFQLTGAALARDIIVIDGKECENGEVIVEADVSHPDLENLKDELQVYEVVDLQNPDARVIWGTPSYRVQLWRIGVTVSYATTITYPSYIRYIQPNYLIYPTDADPNQWGLHNTGQTGGTPDADIDAPEAWAFAAGKTLNDVTVAVIDSGADYNHPALQGRMWTNPEPGDKYDVHGYDFVSDTGDPADDFGHGTHVAGIIASVCPSAKIMALKFIDADGYGLTSDAVKALYYAVEKGAKIVNNSWEGTDSDALRKVLEKARQRGMLLTAGAGNAGADNDAASHFPSGYDLDNIISVAATDHNDALADFSNFGAASVDLAAPGDEIYSALPGGSYGYKSGTSMATAYVSGGAALLWSLDPGLSYADVKERLMNTTDMVPALNTKSVAGRLNVYQSLDSVCEFREFQTIPTNGASNFEFFTIDGNYYLAVANWPWAEPDSDSQVDPNADSKIYQWNGTNFVEFQSIPTVGAEDLKFFSIGDKHFLAIAYHQKTDSKIYQWDGTGFVEFQSLPVIVANNFEFFTIGSDYYLAVALDNKWDSSYEAESKIYKWDGMKFTEFQSIRTHGAFDWEFFTIDGEHYLAIANFGYSIDGGSGFESKIYRWDGMKFLEFQSISTTAAVDWEFFTIDGNPYLAIASKPSKIYRWDGSGFIEFQAADGEYYIASNWEFFTIGGNHYLAAVAYHISTIYQWDGVNFVKFQSFSHNGYGTYDSAFFTIGNNHYLAFPHKYADSKIYKFNCQDSLSLNDGLVAYYPFNGNVDDASGNGLNGVAVGVTLTTDRLGSNGNAYYFNGSSYINVGNSPLLDVNQHTIIAWVKPELKTSNDPARSIIGKVEPLTYETLSFVIDTDNHFSTGFATGDEMNHHLKSSSVIADNQWHFVAMSYDGIKVTFYRDGLTDVSYPRSGVVRTTNSSLAIGRHGGNADQLGDDSFFKGTIDEIRIYSRALSRSEIQALYNESRSNDTDGDALPDTWEQEHFSNLSQNGEGDYDGDGLTNSQEYTLGSDPTDADTDDDGWTDFQEHNAGKDPNDPNDHPSVPENTEIQACPGATVSVPLVLNNVENVAVEGFDVKVEFDRNVLVATGAVLSGSILENEDYDLTFQVEDGEITATVFANGEMFAGSGILMNLEFYVVGDIGDTTELLVTKAKLNESDAGAEIASVKVIRCYPEISGTVRYYSDEKPVSNVLIELEGYKSNSVTTGSDGKYRFSVSRAPADYIVTAYKNDQFGGLSSMDASRIAKYAAGFSDIVFDCYEMAAADVNMDGQITGLDASRVARYAAGKISYLNGKDIQWVFVPVPDTPAVAGICDDWPPIAYESERSYFSLDSDKTDQDFIAVRLGDVTGNWSEESVKTRRFRSVCQLEAASGSALTVPVVLNHETAIEGIDIKVAFDETVLAFKGASLDGGVLEYEGYALVTGEKDGGATLTIPANDETFTGTGEVVFLTFDVIGQPGDACSVSLKTFECNEADAFGGFKIGRKTCNTLSVQVEAGKPDTK